MDCGKYEGFGKLWNTKGDVVYKGYFKAGKTITGEDFSKIKDDLRVTTSSNDDFPNFQITEFQQTQVFLYFISRNLQSGVIVKDLCFA